LQQSIEVNRVVATSPVQSQRLPEEFEPILISVNALLNVCRRALEAGA